MVSKHLASVLSGFVVMALLLAANPVYAVADRSPGTPELPKPSVDLKPGEVVEIVINALARNDQPYLNAGIETTYSFASPANRVNAGSLENFTELVKGPVFGKMVDHRDSTLSQVVLEGNKALRLVQIIGRDNETRYYAFRLGLQQDGEQAGMWLTEAVWPLEAPSDDVLAL